MSTIYLATRAMSTQKIRAMLFLVGGGRPHSARCEGHVVRLALKFLGLAHHSRARTGRCLLRHSPQLARLVSQVGPRSTLRNRLSRSAAHSAESARAAICASSWLSNANAMRFNVRARDLAARVIRNNHSRATRHASTQNPSLPFRTSREGGPMLTHWRVVFMWTKNDQIRQTSRNPSHAFARTRQG